MSVKPGISIIICTYNGARLIGKTLEHIAMQEVPKDCAVEVILIDNASTDGVARVAAESWEQLNEPFELISLEEPRPGKTNAMVMGFDHARYSYMMICDDDNRLMPGYLKRAFEVMGSDEKIGMLGGQGIGDFEREPPDWFKRHEKVYAVGKQWHESGDVTDKIDWLWGAGLVFRAKIWGKLKYMGYEFLLSTQRGKTLISGEDTELVEMARMMGYKLWINNEMKYRHLIPAGRLRWSYLKRFNYGMGRGSLYLNAYTYCRTHDKNPQSGLKLPLWKDTYIHYLKQMVRFVPAIMRHWIVGSRGDDRYLLYTGYRGRMYELRRLKEEYAKIFDKILEYKKRIKELTNA